MNINIIIKIIIILLLIFSIFTLGQIKEIKFRRSIDVKKRISLLTEMYKEINSLLINNDIKLFLIYGTLLGKIRENKIICYDYDLDFGIKNNEYKKTKNLLLNNLNKNKYKLKFINFFNIKFINIIHIKSKLNIDITAFKNNSEKVWRSVPHLYSIYYMNECKGKYPIDWIYPLKKTKFLGQTTYIPNNYHQILKCYYKDYNIPSHTCNADCSTCVKNKKN